MRKQRQIDESSEKNAGEWSDKAERLQKQQRQDDESSGKYAGEWSDKPERLRKQHRQNDESSGKMQVNGVTRQKDHEKTKAD